MNEWPQYLAADEKGNNTIEISKAVDIVWGVKIPKRDSIRLNATICKPANSEPIPVIFTLMPYIGDSYLPRAYYFAQHGYAFALVD